tara:strand:+ start:21367 stop:21789 length:423 start_codon:yes stop_codon:yes gene_type:complete
MKNSFLKLILSICILLSSVYSPLFANVNSGEISLQNTVQHFSIVTSSQNSQHEATISDAINHSKKVLELEAAKIEEEEEEESEPSFFKKGGEVIYASASFYLLSLLFLFTYFEGRNRFETLFNHFFYVNKRFVLFQVFRL